jgi:hypothetical protein
VGDGVGKLGRSFVSEIERTEEMIAVLALLACQSKVRCRTIQAASSPSNLKNK